jgi:hypothetical protein
VQPEPPRDRQVEYIPAAYQRACPCLSEAVAGPASECARLLCLRCTAGDSRCRATWDPFVPPAGGTAPPSMHGMQVDPARGPRLSGCAMIGARAWMAGWGRRGGSLWHSKTVCHRSRAPAVAPSPTLFRSFVWGA